MLLAHDAAVSLNFSAQVAVLDWARPVEPGLLALCSEAVRLLRCYVSLDSLFALNRIKRFS